MGLVERIKDLAGEALASGEADAWTVLDRLAGAMAEGTARSLACAVAGHAPSREEQVLGRICDIVFAHGEAEPEAPGVMAGLQVRWNYWCGPWNVQVTLSDEGYATDLRAYMGRIRSLYVGVEQKPGRPLHWWEGRPSQLEEVLHDITERHTNVQRHVTFDAVA